MCVFIPYLSFMDKTDTPVCAFSGQLAQYQIGYARFNSRKAERLVGYVSADQVEEGINNVMQQLFGTPAWATVHDLDGRLLYHSYDADQKGYSAAVGWSVYLKSTHLPPSPDPET